MSIAGGLGFFGPEPPRGGFSVSVAKVEIKRRKSGILVDNASLVALVLLSIFLVW